MTTILFNSRQQVFSQGNSLPSHSGSLWRIERGVVRTTTWDETGTQRILGYWGPGDVVGLPLSRLNPYQVECKTIVEVSLVPAHLWHEVLDAIVLHAQQAEELLSILHQERIPQRLLQMLVWLAQKFGRWVEQGQLIDVRLTHQELAAVIGTSRVTVSRLLKRFEQAGFIRRLRGHIILCTEQGKTFPKLSKQSQAL